MASPHIVVPLPLSGNTTEQQNRLLQEFLGDALQAVYGKVLELVDRQSAQAILETDGRLRNEIVRLIVELVGRHTISDKFKEEQVDSDRGYPPNYRVRYLEDQVAELRKAFPALKSCQEKLARAPLPDEAEGWFAIPRWQALAPTYNQAVEMVLGVLASRRRFDNRIAGRLGESYLRQSERCKLAERILADQQQGSDVLVVAAQVGMLHRGSSARRTRAAMAPNEFGLGVFAFACMLLTHPERLSAGEILMVDCGGDEYSVRGDYIYDRVPLFEYDLSGIQFSVFYEDRARNLWGSPTGFLYRFS